MCRQKYNEYLHCMVNTKRNEEKCERSKLHYMTVCPNAWVRERVILLLSYVSVLWAAMSECMIVIDNILTGFN